MKAKRTCLLVLGMHRSGTSALTRVLSLLGAVLPRKLMPPNHANGMGFWESSALVEVNDTLLAAVGSRWDDWRALDTLTLAPEELAALEKRIAAVIRNEVGDASLFVLKDPRICRMLPLYLRALDALGCEVRCLLISRNPLEVAASLMVRDGHSEEHSNRLWLRYNLDAEWASRGLSRFFLTYETLMSEGRSLVERIAEWGAGIGLSTDPSVVAAATDHLEPRMHHWIVEACRLDDPANVDLQLAARTYRSLQALERDPIWGEALECLDSIRFELSGGFDLKGIRSVSLPGIARHSIDGLDAMYDPKPAANSGRIKNSRAALLYALDGARSELKAERVLRLATTAALHKEAQQLRAMITRLRVKPLLQLRDNLRHHVERFLAKWLARVGSARSEQYARYAQKRDPKRGVPPLVENPQAAPSSPPAAPLRVVRPVVLVPFEASIMDKRPAMRIAVVLHLFYVDQAEAFLQRFNSIKEPFSLYVSTDTEDKAAVIKQVFELGPAREMEIRILPNRGRDIGPKLVGFADVYDRFDLVLFLHSKASIHTRDLLDGWRDYLLKALVGSPQIVDSILDAFAGAPELGIVAPPNYPPIRNCIYWRGNFDNARDLGRRMGLNLSTDSALDFPAGSMFWARPAALRPLLQAKLRLEDFPEEAGQCDGTIAHAVERLFFYACELSGLRWIRAAHPDQLVETDQALRISGHGDLEATLSDQMPALILPGIRPSPLPDEDPVARLEGAKQEFRAQCRADLEDFLEGDRRLKFERPVGRPKLSVLLVLFNQAELTLHCLESLQRHAGLPIELIIMDNGSSDATSALLERLDGVTLLHSSENLHFLGGVNRAAKSATGDYLLLLNNDARVLPGTIDAAMARLETSVNVGAVGGPIVLLDGTLQEAGSIVFDSGSCLGYGRGRDPGEAEFRFRRDVDFCSGAFLMLRRSLWEELGGFDEAFAPAYYEETDLCMRIWSSGRRVVYEPDAKIVHFEFGSSQENGDAIRQ